MNTDPASPPERKMPNAETRAAMAEAKALLAQHRARFTDGEALIASLRR